MSCWLLWWAACFVLWLLLIAQPGTFELVIGGLAASVAATGACLVALRDETVFSFRWEHARAVVRRLPRPLALDTLHVLAALWRTLLGGHVRGRIRKTPFVYGAEDDPREAARRALVIATVSLTPNSIVIGLEDNWMEVHTLLPAPPPGDRVWPI